MEQGQFSILKKICVYLRLFPNLKLLIYNVCLLWFPHDIFVYPLVLSATLPSAWIDIKSIAS